MHFRSLLTVYLPAVEPDPEWEKEVADQVKQMRESQPENIGSIGQKVMLDIFYEGMNNISTTFGREVTPVIRDVMERFNCGTEDKRFLEFDDRTGEALRDYNATVDCMRLPDGRIVEEYPAPQWHKFIIKDGKVYQRHAGPLHHPKRTKAAKKISVVTNYPRKKLYGNSFERYIEEATYFTRNEETGKYGEWYNPDGVYDWYSIGGRWPRMFLVKNECTEYSLGESAAFKSNENANAPEGYRWVCCARKKDIQWDVMRKWLNNRATDRYTRLRAMYKDGILDDDIHGTITEKGITDWGELVYTPDMTLEEYLNQYGIPDEWKYPIGVYAIFHSEEYMDKHSVTRDNETGKYSPIDWRKAIDQFIDEADDDDVFVGIDYHI